MVSYNEARDRAWPFNTASGPPIRAEAPFSHPLTLSDSDTPPVDSSQVLMFNGTVIPGAVATQNTPPTKTVLIDGLNQTGSAVSPRTTLIAHSEIQTLEIKGDESEYGDQFESAPISVLKNTDYVLILPVTLVQGDMALKVTSGDRRIALAIADVAQAKQEARSNDPTLSNSKLSIQLPFATGNRTEVRIVLSNNSVGPIRPGAMIGAADLVQMGATGYRWTSLLRPAIRGVQRLFTTGRVVFLILIGIGLLLVTHRFATIALLLAIPAYYIAVQAPIHTEYRYILAIHYFLLSIGAVTLYCFWAIAAEAARALGKRRSLSLRPAPEMDL